MFSKGKDKAPQVTDYEDPGIVPGFESYDSAPAQVPGNAVVLQRVLQDGPNGTKIPVEINHTAGEKYEMSPEQEHRELIETFGHDPSLLSPVAPLDMTMRSGELTIGPGTISYKGELSGQRWDYLMGAAPILAARSAAMVDPSYYDQQTDYRQTRERGTVPAGYEPPRQPALDYYGEAEAPDEAHDTDELEDSPAGQAAESRTIVPASFSIRSLREVLRRHPKTANWVAFGIFCSALFNIETGRISSDGMFVNAHNVGVMAVSPYNFYPVAKNATVRVANDVMNVVHAAQTVKNGVAKVGGLFG